MDKTSISIFLIIILLSGIVMGFFLGHYLTLQIINNPCSYIKSYPVLHNLSFNITNI